MSKRNGTIKIECHRLGYFRFTSATADIDGSSLSFIGYSETE